MIRLTCLALFVLFLSACGGNGEDDGGTDQRSANTDENSAPAERLEMKTYEMRLLDGDIINIEAPVGMYASDGGSGRLYAKLMDENENRLWFEGTHRDADYFLKAKKESLIKQAKRTNDDSHKFLVETEDTLISIRADGFDVEGFWLATFDDKNIFVQSSYMQLSKAKYNAVEAVKESLGWARKSLKFADNSPEGRALRKKDTRGKVEVADLFEEMSKGGRNKFGFGQYLITGGVLLRSEEKSPGSYYLYLGKAGGKPLLSCTAAQDQIDRAKQLKVGQEVKIVGKILRFRKAPKPEPFDHVWVTIVFILD